MPRSFSRLKQLRRHPSLLIGLVLIAIPVGMALYAVIAIPHPEAVRLWRDPGESIENPMLARPVWVDRFTSDRLPRTIQVRLADEGATLTEEAIGDGLKVVEVVLPFEYHYDGFPSELTLFTRVTGGEKDTPISVFWQTPAGDTIVLGEYHARQSHSHRISQDRDLWDRLGMLPHFGLFVTDPTVPREERGPMQGRYELIVMAEIREGHSLDVVSLTVYGRVHGPFGTDHVRRDLTVPMVWGAVFGLGFGVVAALACQVGAVIVAASRRWRGERGDPLFWRLTDVNMVLLALPLFIAVGYFVSPSRGVMLLTLLLLSLLIALIRVLRERLVPSSGAPDTGPTPGSKTTLALLLPSFLLLIPAFVFVDAALYILDLAGDPLLPSWGSTLYDAFGRGALLHGHYYWIIQPLALLMVIGIGFAMAGYALHRISN